MNTDTIPLCCCEYFDENNQRNHILACCCNCVDLDEGFDSLIRGRGFPQTNKSGVMATLHDRLRIPWRGGAKQIQFDAILPIIILPISFLLSAISLWWTVFTFTAIIVILLSIFRFFIYTIPKTKFFLIWTITTIILLYIIFEFIVIPLLQILVEENIILSLFIAGFILCFYLMKVRTNQLLQISEESAIEMGGSDYSANGTPPSTMGRCNICQILVPGRDHHCVWLDCCIGRHNQCLFIASLFFAILALLYSSNLTLTSVCHPFVFYKMILLPDDCSDVYQQYELGLSFVSAIYSLCLAIILLIIFLQQLLLVSIGLTMKEWMNLSLLAKCCLGLLFVKNRPNNLGFRQNWLRIICWKRNYHILN